MKSKKAKKIWIVVFIIILIVFAALGYWKRVGIKNRLFHLMGISTSKEKELIGFYKQEIKTDTDLSATVSVLGSDNAENIETTIKAEETLIPSSAEIDQQIEQELNSGNYSWETPLVISNPYRISPLTGVILFQTDQNYTVRVTVKGKTKETDIVGEIAAGQNHRIPVVGLYPNMENTVILELINDDKEVTATQEIKMKTSGLPELMNNMVKAETISGESAFPLTMVYGQKCKYPFAYDQTGDIRWFLEKETSYHGLYHLSNNRFLIEDVAAFVPTQEEPRPTNLYEMDYLGRTYSLYYMPNGVHHEVIEKEAGGNLLVLSSSLDGHFEDRILEIDRQTGEIVNQLDLKEIFGDIEYTKKTDWAHINTVSYQSEDDTILISARNVHSGMKIKWSEHELVWILGAPEFWKDTGFEDKVLQPTEDFTWHFQQHTVYQLETDLDQNPGTVEISLFDNHWQNSRKVDYFDELEDSYVMVYAIDEEKMTVSQLKKIATVKSKVTSNTIYDEASNHIFGMCGYLPEPIAGRNGMTYEFDYDTEEVINQFSIKSKFYRATQMKIDYDDLASAMDIDTDYIKGNLRASVETKEHVSVPDKLIKDQISLKMVGGVLHIKALDHRMSQVIFKGEQNTYVWDASELKQYKDKYQKIEKDIPIPLQNLKADTYEVLCMYEDEFCTTGEQITVK